MFQVEVTMQLIIQDNKVDDIKFTGKGCAISIASASLITEKVKGMNIEDIKTLDKDDVLNLLKIPISPVRLKCALLPLDTVRGAVEK